MLLEAGPFKNDLATFHLTNENIYIEDEINDNHMILSSEKNWSPEAYKGQFPQEVKNGVDFKIEPKVTVEGDDVGSIYGILPIKGDWSLRVSGKVNPEIDGCSCYETEYEVKTDLDFYQVEKKGEMYSPTGKKASGSKTETGKIGDCEGKSLSETLKVERDIDIKPMMIDGDNAVGGSCEIDLTVKGYK